MSKKNNINYVKNMGKYVDYENLPPKCISDDNYSFFIIKYFTNLLSNIYFWFNLIFRYKNAKLRSLFSSRPMRNIIY